jgi:hypothetical protein
MFSPILDTDSAAYVHHMILYACEADGSQGSSFCKFGGLEVSAGRLRFGRWVSEGTSAGFPYRWEEQWFLVDFPADPGEFVLVR